MEITFRDLARDASRLPGFIDEIRRTRPDLVYTWGTSVTLGVAGAAGKADSARHITDIPVVFTLVAAPVQAGIVPALNSSGRNVTGVYHVAPVEAQIRAMAAYRAVRSIGVIYTPTEQNSVAILKELETLGTKSGFSVVARPFRVDAAGNPVAEGAANLVAELKRAQVQWLYLLPDTFLGTLAAKTIIPAASAAGLPTFASTEQLMDAGALAGLVSGYRSIGQFTAYTAQRILVDKIAPKDIPIETLKRFSFRVRMDTARQLQLMPPLQMFNYAEVIGSN